MSGEMSEYDEYRYAIGEMIIDAVMEGRFDALFDQSFQVVFGYFPPERRWRARFDHPRQFRVWRTKTVKLYLQWVTKAKYPPNEKLLISSEFYNAIGLKPEPEWAKKRRKRRK